MSAADKLLFVSGVATDIGKMILGGFFPLTVKMSIKL